MVNFSHLKTFRFLIPYQEINSYNEALELQISGNNQKLNSKVLYLKIIFIKPSIIIKGRYWFL